MISYEKCIRFHSPNSYAIEIDHDILIAKIFETRFSCNYCFYRSLTLFARC